MTIAQPLPLPTDLPAGLEIWAAALDGIAPATLATLENLLAHGERERAARFRFEAPRRHFIAARGILRQLLGAACGRAPEQLVFSYGPQGKPELADNPGVRGRPLYFNLSHSGGQALFALACGQPVGIDIEAGERLAAKGDELGGLAARVLTPAELKVWRALPDTAARRVAFLRAWTRKEAYGKATGNGVFDGLTHVEVALDAATPAATLRLLNRAAAGSAWLICDLPAPTGFAAAIAIAESAESGGGAERIFRPL